MYFLTFSYQYSTRRGKVHCYLYLLTPLTLYLAPLTRPFPKSSLSSLTHLHSFHYAPNAKYAPELPYGESYFQPRLPAPVCVSAALPPVTPCRDRAVYPWQ